MRGLNLADLLLLMLICTMGPFVIALAIAYVTRDRGLDWKD